MSFCGALATALTDSDLQKTYGTMEQPGLLPADGFSADQRDEKGLLNAVALKANVTNLIASGKVPRPPKPAVSTSDQLETYIKKDKLFVDNLRKEYCFYDARYRYALKQLISKLQAGYTDNTDVNSQLIQSYLKFTQGLNQRLNDLTQLSNAIAKERVQYTKDQSKASNALNAQMAQRSAKLNKQNHILSSEQATAILYKDMVNYTKERADSTNNLLSLYSFMNIVVLGLLVYLYRSASS